MTVEFKQDGQEVKIENIHQVIYDELSKCVSCYDDHGSCKYNIDLNDVKWFTTYDTTSSEMTEVELNINKRCISMEGNDCKQCIHQEVCIYKEKYDNIVQKSKDQPTPFKISCEFYRYDSPIFSPPKGELPKDHGEMNVPYYSPSTIGTIDSEGFCDNCWFYQTTFKKEQVYIGDSPCDWCIKRHMSFVSSPPREGQYQNKTTILNTLSEVMENNNDK